MEGRAVKSVTSNPDVWEMKYNPRTVISNLGWYLNVTFNNVWDSPRTEVIRISANGTWALVDLVLVWFFSPVFWVLIYPRPTLIKGLAFVFFFFPLFTLSYNTVCQQLGLPPYQLRYRMSSRPHPVLQAASNCGVYAPPANRPYSLPQSSELKYPLLTFLLPLE